MIKCPMLFAVTLCTSMLIAEEELVLSGDYPVTVASGQTSTISAKVTGTGRIVLDGGGTLVFNNAANDFTGGIVVSNGIVRADASGAFGTGPITLEGTADTRTVALNAVKGEFPNDIVLKDKTSSSDNPVVHAMQPAKVSGDISIDPALLASEPSKKYLYFATDRNTVDTYTAMLEVSGECNAGAGRVALGGGSDNNSNSANYRFKGKITASLMDAGLNVNRKAIVYLHSPDNAISTLRPATFNIHLEDENVLSGTMIELGYNWQWGARRDQGRVYFNGNNQTIAGVNSKYNAVVNNIPVTDYDASLTSDSLGINRPATVTFVGRPDVNVYTEVFSRLQGDLSLVVDKRPDAKNFYQRFAHFENTMTGDITVKNGVLELRKGATFPNVEKITVTGGTCYMQTVTNIFPKLTTLTVSGGKVNCESNCRNPIGGGLADVYLSGDGQLQFRDGVTNTVRRLYVNGEYMPAGIYTKDVLPAMAPSGDRGALVVLQGRSGMIMTVK